MEDFYLVPFLENAQRLAAVLEDGEPTGEGESEDGLAGDVDDDVEDPTGETEEFVELFGQLARPVMPLRRILIPSANRSAWMSSLNGARLLIANCFGFMDAMPEREGHYDPDDPEQLALLIMDALGELEHLLVEVERSDGF